MTTKTQGRKSRRVRHWAVKALLLMGPLAPCSTMAGTLERGAGEQAISACIHKLSAGRPWLEKTLWGLRDQEAGWIGAEVLNADGSHDLGPLQVNSWWVSKIAETIGRPSVLVRKWLVYDPCFNVDAARWIFLSGLAVTGDYWKAIGVYHSPTRWRQSAYAEHVAARLRRRFGSGIFRDAD